MPHLWVSLVVSEEKTLRRIGDRRYDARMELGEDPGKVMIDGVSYLTGVIGWAPGGGRLVFYACPSDPIMADGRLYSCNAASLFTRLSNPPGGSPVGGFSQGAP